MSRNNRAPPNPSNIVYVGLIPFDWDEETLKSVVCGSGRVTDVRLGFDYAGKNKGFCFIEYLDPPEAQRGMNLLGQIKLLTPGGRQQYKKLRIELSKEGFRTNASDQKQILDLNRDKFPPNVQLPQEMIANGPPLPQNAGHQAPFMQNQFQNQNQNNQFNQFPNQFQNQQFPNQQFQNQQFPNQNLFQQPQFQQNQQFQMQNQPVSRGPPMPQRLTQITQTLPQVTQLPFAIPDEINKNLSSIPPAQLIELIANLKNILNGPNSARAADVFQLSPNLATAAGQALLLMGLIDSDVIKESMNSNSGTPQPQQPPTNFNSFAPPPPPPQTSKWPHLPQHTQAKLSAMAPDQADLIAQVLLLPVDQIMSLPPDRQQMVNGLRQQYL